MDAQKPSWKAWCHGLLYMLSVTMLIGTSQAHVQGGHHKRVERSSFQAAHSALFNQVYSIPAPSLGRREMQTIVLTTTISTYIELRIPCDATAIPQSMSSLLTRPPPLSIPTSLGTIATGGNSLTAPDGGSPVPPQTSTLRSTSVAEKPNPSSSNSLSSSQTSFPFTTGAQSSTIDHTSTSDSSSAPAVPDTSTAASRSTIEPSKPATSTSTATSITNIRISTQSISSGTTESSVALSSSSSTRNITTVVVSSTIVVLWPGTESTSSVDDSTTTQTVIVSPSSAPASPDVHPRLPTDSNLPGSTKRIVRFSQRIWYTENKHQIMVIATYEDNHVVTVYTAPKRTDLPAVLVLDDQNGNKRGSLKMTFRMGFFTIDFRSEMAGRVVEWDNHWTKNEADEDAPWCETVFLKDDGKERLARETWCYYTA
ncbi:hypothetical protein K4K54_003473 [Colletotrichum sp. SAR 10_86]|nr:hypothetical protein K4K50_001876 [Colletotrichum sp. SAR 10_71]KAI8238336.1 hypothetical protein K4K54_003473 [Colletotrichum sp. SAR 10_86]